MKKQEMRKRLASLSFSEKISILKKLRDRSLAIAASGLRGKPLDPEKTVNLPGQASQSREPHTKS
jgi:hypothetical protein